MFVVGLSALNMILSFDIHAFFGPPAGALCFSIVALMYLRLNSPFCHGYFSVVSIIAFISSHQSVVFFGMDGHMGLFCPYVSMAWLSQCSSGCSVCPVFTVLLHLISRMPCGHQA